jgi:hypothetical protein
MTAKTALALLAMALLAAGCKSMKTTSERDPAFNFGAVKTFQWVDAPEEILNKADTYINEDIRTALDRQLTDRGLLQVQEEGEADIQVVYYVKLREEVEYTETANPDERKFSGGFVYDRDSSGWQYAEREPDLNVYTVEIGKLTVLMFDSSTGQRVWRGTLQTEIDRSQPNEKQEERIAEAAKKLMAKLPVVASE